MNLNNKLLVAAPHNTESYRAVVFVLIHDEDRSTGLCVNHRTSRFTSTTGVPVYQGGSVGFGSVNVLLHGIRLLGRKGWRIMPGIWQGTPRVLKRAVRIPLDDRRIKLFSGYSTWEPGQLEREIAEGLWSVREATPELVFDADSDVMWADLTPDCWVDH